MKQFFMVLMLFMVTVNGLANEAKPMGEEPALEARLKSVSQELRCLVCQNATLAPAPAAPRRVGLLTDER